MTTRERDELHRASVAAAEARTAAPLADMACVTMQEVADALGVHYNTIYRAVADGRIPSLRVGRAVRIRVADLERLRHDPGAVARGAATAAARQRPPRARAPRGEFARRARGLDPA